MTRSLTVIFAVVGFASLSWVRPVHADSTSATCEVRREGEKNTESSGPCTFSQRQGYIDLDLKNGNTFSLSPTGKPDHFKDQKGQAVVRTQAGGDRQDFKWDNGKHITVTFGDAGSGGGAASGGGAKNVSDAEMRRTCTGQAAGRYNVRPTYVTLANNGYVFPATDGFSIAGVADLGTQGKRRFNCIFGKDRAFKTLDVGQADGD